MVDLNQITNVEENDPVTLSQLFPSQVSELN